MEGRSTERKPYTKFEVTGLKSLGTSAGKYAAIRRSGIPDFADPKSPYAIRFMDQYNFWIQKPVGELDYMHGKIEAGSFITYLKRRGLLKGLLEVEINEEGKVEKVYIGVLNEQILKLSEKKSPRFLDGYSDRFYTRMKNEESQKENQEDNKEDNKEDNQRINNKRKREADTNEAITKEQSALKRPRLLPVSKANVPAANDLPEFKLLPTHNQTLPSLMPLLYGPGGVFAPLARPQPSMPMYVQPTASYSLALQQSMPYNRFLNAEISHLQQAENAGLSYGKQLPRGGY
jgi:hypothetical protein